MDLVQATTHLTPEGSDLRLVTRVFTDPAQSPPHHTLTDSTTATVTLRKSHNRGLKILRHMIRVSNPLPSNTSSMSLTLSVTLGRHLFLHLRIVLD